jgi:DNA-nicking Smr family endonuclease
MTGKKPSLPNLEIDFLETGHEDRYMKDVFEHVDQVPDKEPLPKIPPPKKHKVKYESPFSQLNGADEQVDLHGKTREEAIIIVQNFIKTSHAQGLRHILIITGRGQHSGSQGPVLKTSVIQWLKKKGHPYLKEFRDAPPRFGGSGAIWVELK